MATTTQTDAATQNGGGSARTFTVENPATGADDRRAARARPRRAPIALVERARAAQPAWHALGFKRRAAYMKDMRAWMVRNRERIIRTLGRGGRQALRGRAARALLLRRRTRLLGQEGRRSG